MRIRWHDPGAGSPNRGGGPDTGGPDSGYGHGGGGLDPFDPGGGPGAPVYPHGKPGSEEWRRHTGQWGWEDEHPNWARARQLFEQQARERGRRRDVVEPGWRERPYDPSDPLNKPGALGNFGMTPGNARLVGRFMEKHRTLEAPPSTGTPRYGAVAAPDTAPPPSPSLAAARRPMWATPAGGDVPVSGMLRRRRFR